MGFSVLGFRVGRPMPDESSRSFGCSPDGRENLSDSRAVMMQAFAASFRHLCLSWHSAVRKGTSTTIVPRTSSICYNKNVQSSAISDNIL